MKKKVFRERYNLVLDENAGTINIPKIDIEDIKDYRKEEVIEEVKEKPKKRGRRKSVKSDK